MQFFLIIYVLILFFIGIKLFILNDSIYNHFLEISIVDSFLLELNLSVDKNLEFPFHNLLSSCYKIILSSFVVAIVLDVCILLISAQSLPYVFPPIVGPATFAFYTEIFSLRLRVIDLCNLILSSLPT
jgi:hypothetical protein